MRFAFLSHGSRKPVLAVAASAVLFAWACGDAGAQPLTDSCLSPASVIVERFCDLQPHGDPLAFHYGVKGTDTGGDEPTDPQHYQGIARGRDVDSVPYLILSRNGNKLLGTIGDPEGPAEILVVRMGAPAANDDERLGPNRVEPGQPASKTAPAPESEYHVVASLSLGGTPPHAWRHAGGLQLIGTMLLVPLEQKCAASGCGKEASGPKRGAIMLVDVKDPTAPTLIKTIETYVDGAGPPQDLPPIGVLGVATRGTKFLFALSGGTNFSFSGGPFDHGKSVKFFESDTLDMATELTFLNDWHSSALACGCWSDWQSINLIQGVIGGTYLLGMGNLSNPFFGDGNHAARLFRVETAGDGTVSLEYVTGRRLSLSDPPMGDLDWASGAYFSPGGNLIIYTAEGNNTGPKGDEDRNILELGEFRDVDLNRKGQLIGVCHAWVELYKDDTGWDDSSPETSFLVEGTAGSWQDRSDLAKEDFGDDASSLRWNLPGDFTVRLYEHDTFKGRYLELSSSTAVFYEADDTKATLQPALGSGELTVLFIKNLEDIGFGDDVSSVAASACP